MFQNRYNGEPHLSISFAIKTNKALWVDHPKSNLVLLFWVFWCLCKCKPDSDYPKRNRLEQKALFIQLEHLHDAVLFPKLVFKTRLLQNWPPLVLGLHISIGTKESCFYNRNFFFFNLYTKLSNITYFLYISVILTF